MRYTYTQPEYLDRVGVIHLVQQLKVYIDGIATGDIDLSDYVTKAELQAKLDALDINIDLSAYATKEELTNALNNIDLSAYALKTEIPSLEGYATQEYVTDAINNAQLSGDGSSVDLSIYAKKSDLDNKSDIAHTHTMSDITDYTAPDLSSYAKKTDIPSLSGYATKTYVDQNKFSGSYNDLTDKPTIPSIDGLATTEYVDNAVSNIPTGECVIKGREKDITSTFISPRTVTECELPALPTFEGGTKLYAQTSVLPNSKVFTATMRDKNENLNLDNYVLNEGNYVTLPDTTDGYVDDYIFYGMDLTIGENNPTTIPTSYSKCTVIGRANDYDSATQTYRKYEYVDTTDYTNDDYFNLRNGLIEGDTCWTPYDYAGNGERDNTVIYNVREVQGEILLRMQGLGSFIIWIFIDDVFYKRIDGVNVTKSIDVSNASQLTIIMQATSSTDYITNTVFWSYPTYKNITLNFYTESLDGTHKSDVHTLEFGEGKTMPLTDFDKSKILRYSSDSIIQYIDEPLVDYVSEKIYTKTEVNKLMSGYATENYVLEHISTITEGKDGITPHIDESTKHWFIGDTDTGILAEGRNGTNGTNGVDGQNGTDGYTPVRGTDYWTQEDINTIKAYIDAELGVIENGSY